MHHLAPQTLRPPFLWAVSSGTEWESRRFRCLPEIFTWTVFLSSVCSSQNVHISWATITISVGELFEHLLCAGHCSKCLKHISEQNKILQVKFWFGVYLVDTFYVFVFVFVFIFAKFVTSHIHICSGLVLNYTFMLFLILPFNENMSNRNKYS